ncbi:MAG: pyruvate formate lyase 1-activating protein, partial [Erysipelotrichaceae bacterium]|nr:pyruvate formate lyase 1-activating protein [Erysipelotrichaceae bacterium]
MDSIKGRLHSIESFGCADGPGIRFVIFLQG